MSDEKPIARGKIEPAGPLTLETLQQLIDRGREGLTVRHPDVIVTSPRMAAAWRRWLKARG